MSQSKRPGDELDDRSAKTHRSEQENSKPERSDSTEPTDPDPQYSPTGVNDVFQVDQGIDPVMAKSDLQDWKHPIVLVITKGTRDNFLRYMEKFTNNQTTESKSTSEIEINFPESIKLQNEFQQNVNALNGILSSFREKDLQEDLATPSELAKFRQMRKKLTDFYVFGNKSLNMVNNVKQGDVNYMLRQKHEIIPNRLSETFLKEIDMEMKKNSENINAKIFNQTIQDCLKTTRVTEEMIRTEPRKLLAKAWRTVKKSNRYVSKSQFRRNDRYDRPQETGDEPHYEAKRTNRDYRPRENRGEPTHTTRNQRPSQSFRDDEKRKERIDRRRPREYDRNYNDRKRNYQEQPENHERPGRPHRHWETRRPSYRQQTWYSKRYRNYSDTDDQSESEYHRDYPTPQESYRDQTQHKQTHYTYGTRHLN